MTYDDNLFELPSTSQLPPGATSDGSTWINVDTADLSFDRQYSSQTFHADVSLSRNNYTSLHYLDYNAVSYTARWQWQLGNRLSGTVGVDREQFLGSYSDFQNYTIPNLQTHTAQTFKLDWDASGPWHVVAGILHAQESSPAAFTQIGTFSQTDGQFGMSYVSQLGSSVTLQARDSLGTFSRALDYVDMLDTGYKQREAEVLTHLIVGAWTTADARIGYVDRRYDTFGQRDYQGWVGQLQLNWQPSAHTLLTLVGSRDLVSFEAPDSSYYWLNAVNVGPAWDITSKIRLDGSVGLSWRTFEGAIGAGPDVGRSDLIGNARLGMTYKPTLNSSISLYATVSQRRSTLAEFGYHDKTVGMEATLQF
jgi:exopolysaccharide biosynthesis operon protein EpsL